MRLRYLGAVALWLCFAATSAHATDRVDDLNRALTEDPSYKVRVQAALVLGKLGDGRAVPALIQALTKDDNETVRGVAAASLGYLGDRSAIASLKVAANDRSAFISSQAKKALSLLGVSLDITPLPGRSNAKYFFSVGFQSAAKYGPEFAEALRATLIARLQRNANVTLSINGMSEPSEKLLGQKQLTGYIIDGNVQKLSATSGSGGKTIDCDVKAYIATFPGRSIRVMTQEGASLQTGSALSAESAAKRECLQATAESIGDDLEKFLRTLE